MTVSSAQLMQRLGIVNAAETFRLRDIVGIEGRGSGHRMEYDERVADVMVTIWTAMLDIGLLNGQPKGQRTAGLSHKMYRKLAERPMTDDWASLECGVVAIQVDIVKTDWSTVTPPTLAGTDA